MLQSFPPIIDQNSRILILGSMPSVKSLEKQEYYGNPQNHFWRILSSVLAAPVPSSYTHRKSYLHAHHIALWDVVAECQREGSLDQNIHLQRTNDINALILSYPTIIAVFFNGTAAAKIYHQHFSPVKSVTYFTLPSSSPIPRRYIRTCEDKLPFWSQILDYL